MQKRKSLMLIVLAIIIMSLSFLPACNIDNLPNQGVTPNDNLHNDTTDDNQIDEIVESPEEQEETETEETETEETEQEVLENKMVLALGNLNVRSTPTTNEANIIGLFRKNTTLELIEKYNSYWNIVNYNGETAYISSLSKYSQIIDDNMYEETNRIESVIASGMDVLGTPYEYGSTRILYYGGDLNPYFTGRTFDCSAFVQYAFYMGAGIKLQGDSRSQSREGQLIALDELERGDIIFMTSTARQYNTGISRIGHVAIYLGDNQILHTFGTGGVRVQTYSSFWRGRAILARRMW